MTDQDHLALLHTIALRNADSELAMRQLYRALSGSVFAFVRRRLSQADDHEVQAVVVDTMYEVWRAAADFNGISQLKTWVLGIARHKLLDAVRKKPDAALHDDVAEYAESLADENADIVASLVTKQRAEWLVCCMNKLPEEQRESLHLLLVEGLSMLEIAEVQGCPSGTVKTRVFYAKAKLKTCLARWLLHEHHEPIGAGAPLSQPNSKVTQ